MIDIGSNSVRLVVYEGLTRSPTGVFNEKTLCGLGKSLATTGRLDPSAVEKALAALKRFRTLCDTLKVKKLYVIATAAAREAKDGRTFIRNAEKICRCKIDVLSGKREAKYSALGIISSFHKPDGVVGNGTLAYLNQPVGQRVLQIIANMERWRWMPATMPATRVQVNSGAAIVTLFRDDKPVLSMKAVSGKKGDETPMLVSAIHSVVINPPWNVPSRIANEELWPKERANPGYLAAHNYRVIPVQGGQPRLQQASGDSSALGRF